jgi:hypothetical protein
VACGQESVHRPSLRPPGKALVWESQAGKGDGLAVKNALMLVLVSCSCFAEWRFAEGLRFSRFWKRAHDD